jgi:alpha-galactosidase
MARAMLWPLVLFVVLGLPLRAQGVAEISTLQPGPPFSFVYDAKKSAGLLPAWKRTPEPAAVSGDAVRQRVTYADPKTGLEVRLETVTFSDFPAVEWVLHFKNTGAVDTPILENILPLDIRVPVSGLGGRHPVLHYAKGALCSIDDFAPVDAELAPNARVHLEPGGGRSSSEVLPFFNVDCGTEGLRPPSVAMRKPPCTHRRAWP